MSEQNDEVKLAHWEYLAQHSIDVEDLPEAIDKDINAIDNMIDDYEESADESKLPAIQQKSVEISAKIKAWHEAKNVKPVEPPVPPKPVNVGQTQTHAQHQQAPVSPAQPTEDDEDDSWSYTQFLK
jgi:hypothetical protein